MGMVEVLLFVNIGLLVIGAVTLTIAAFVLQKARSYVELAERRMERLREGQEHLFRLVSEEPAREVPVSQPQREAEPEIAELEKELQRLRSNRENDLSRQVVAHQAADPMDDPAPNVKLLTEDPQKSGEAWVSAKVPSANSPGEVAQRRTEKAPEVKQPGVAIKHAHPDDDVSLQRASVERAGARRDSSPIKVFREHYHRYLENYEGYVKLAERLCQMREDGEVPPGSPAEREWEQKLRRLNDGIQRTTARLDILEQYNPELASDDRVTHRAEIAQSYSELEEKLTNPETT